MKTGKFNCIVDAAWGSSAKGAASCRLVDLYRVPNASTCNYPNAGHTATLHGNTFISKCLPTPAFLHMVGIHTPKLWVGPNSGFTLKQFESELKTTGYAMEHINLHERAVVVSDRHILAESPEGSQSTEHISSTMSGSGAAYTEKAMRHRCVDTAKSAGLPSMTAFEFASSVRTELENGRTFMHEVSQGFALSVNHGTHYPTCTFRDCTSQQAWADFCIAPEFIGDVYLNVRSFPIRVGNNFRNGVQTGYSGQFMPDQIETTWEQIAQDAEMPDDVASQLAERERTTVTKKIRRVATQSWSLLYHSAKAVAATKLILNFPQYIHWSCFKMRGDRSIISSLHPKVRAYIDRMEDVTGLPVVMLGTGPEHYDYIDLSN